ncbi:hypothetical protein GCM10020001_084660 [Nonomuraea salmonea]
MTTPSTRVGRRAEITGMLHSPAATRAWASFLLGRFGTVIAVLRNGTLALLALDGDAHEMPGGVKRWPIHLDDHLPCPFFRHGDHVAIQSSRLPPRTPSTHRVAAAGRGAERQARLRVYVRRSSFLGHVLSCGQSRTAGVA